MKRKEKEKEEKERKERKGKERKKRRKGRKRKKGKEKKGKGKAREGKEMKRKEKEKKGKERKRKGKKRKRKEIWGHIRSKIVITNLVHLAHIEHFRSKCLSRNTKLKLYKPLIGPKRSILTDWSETWTVANEGTNVLRVFERKDVTKKYVWTHKGRSL